MRHPTTSPRASAHCAINVIIPSTQGSNMAQYRFERVQTEYLELWTKMKVLKAAEAKAQAQKVISHKDRYKTVEGKTSVPWFVVGCLHMRESNGNFNTWLH